MDKLKIAVFIEDDFNPTVGGGFSYYERLISKIDGFEFDEKIEINYFSTNE